MNFPCTDILLVKTDGSTFYVEAPSNTADVGSIVHFDGGKTGTVAQCIFIGGDLNILSLIRGLTDTYTAEKIFLRYWQKEEAHADP